AADAVWAVNDVAGAAEAPLQRLRVEAGQALVVRVEHQVAGDAPGPVATGVVAGMEQPQVLVRAHRGGQHTAPRSQAARAGGCLPAEPDRARVNAGRGGGVDGGTAALEPQSPRNPHMKHRTLFTALAIALMAAAGASAAEPANAPQRGTKPTLDANGDGVIDRAEAAKFPRLAARFDQLDRNGDGRLDASERPRHGHGHGLRHGRGGPRGGHFGHFQDPARLDTDNDGRLSKAEVEAAGQGRGKRGNRMLEQFDAIDANRDGYLVRSEIRAWHAQQMKQRRAGMEKRF